METPGVFIPLGCELEMEALALKGEPLAVDSLDALRNKPVQSRFIGV
jgi:hypothetical protein